MTIATSRNTASQQGKDDKKERNGPAEDGAFHGWNLFLNLPLVYCADLARSYAVLVRGCRMSDIVLKRNMVNFKAFPLPQSSISWGYV